MTIRKYPIVNLINQGLISIGEFQNGTMTSNVASLRAMRDSVRAFPIVLVTGGSGYIGSHTVLEILKVGCAVVVVDNLVNSHMESLIRVYHIAKAEYVKLGLDEATVPPLIFHKADLRSIRSLSYVFQLWQLADPPLESLERKLEVMDIGALAANADYKMRDYPMDTSTKPKELVPPTSTSIHRGMIMAVIHFAALKAVGDSVSKPLAYYQNNISGLLNLLDAMSTYKVSRLVFSSSAVVYGTGMETNISEDSVQVGGQGAGGGLVTNPYGRSKWMAEEILNDCCIANPEFEVIALRYFNPSGSHPSGLIGEDPKGTPNNIVPVILQAYQRRRSKVYVYGSNYDTDDGTGVRDYIHVGDLARGHLAALRSMMPKITPPPVIRNDRRQSFAVQAVPQADRKQSFAVNHDANDAGPKYKVYNLGTGRGYSVLDIIKAFAAAAGTEIPFAMAEARAGDLGTVTASTQKATTELGWEAEFGIQDMCRDVYTFATENPVGYERLRKLSTLAMRDPQTMRKASVAAGLWSKQTNLENIVEEFANLSCDKTSFNEIIRRMSTMSAGIRDELRKGSVCGPRIAANPTNSLAGPLDRPQEEDETSPGGFLQSGEPGGQKPGWGIFSEQWHDQTLPVHAK